MHKKHNRPATADDIPAIIEQLGAIYDESVANLRNALARYIADRAVPDPAERAKGIFAYPELRIEYADLLPGRPPARAFGRLNHPGVYATSIARPRLFRK